MVDAVSLGHALESR
jgi:hypothetical protein